MGIRITKPVNSSGVSMTQANFNRDEFVVETGQLAYPLTFVLTVDSIVIVNGSSVPQNEYVGFGSYSLVFNNALEENDKVVVIG